MPSISGAAEARCLQRPSYSGASQASSYPRTNEPARRTAALLLAIARDADGREPARFSMASMNPRGSDAQGTPHQSGTSDVEKVVRISSTLLLAVTLTVRSAFVADARDAGFPWEVRRQRRPPVRAPFHAIR